MKILANDLTISNNKKSIPKKFKANKVEIKGDRKI